VKYEREKRRDIQTSPFLVLPCHLSVVVIGLVGVPPNSWSHTNNCESINISQQTYIHLLLSQRHTRIET
jgi:hypothetical protein